jgi:hypothetical protein
MENETLIPKKEYMSISELTNIVAHHRSNIDLNNAKEVQSVLLLETAMFHVDELTVCLNKTREDLNRVTAYADNLRTELKTLLNMAQSYLQESSMIRTQLDEVKKDFYGK